METLPEQRCHGGVQGLYRHASRETGTPMRFAVYIQTFIADHLEHHARGLAG